jgi:hypothetical protein
MPPRAAFKAEYEDGNVVLSDLFTRRRLCQDTVAGCHTAAPHVVAPPLGQPSAGLFLGAKLQCGPTQNRRGESIMSSGVFCTNCGHELRDRDETPYPKCGDARKTFGQSADSQIGQSVTVEKTATNITEELRLNWPLVAVLLGGDAMSTVPAYWLSSWCSVAVTLAFIFFSTVVGYYAITRVIKIQVSSR